MSTRSERDSLGTKQIPADALYGIQTLRATENFPISDEILYPEIVRAYATIKKCSAQVNADLEKLDQSLAREIMWVCDDIIAGKYSENFVVGMFQAWAWTSANMNLNEVIANKILEQRGEQKGNYQLVSPNDHVNMSQSTNDTFPTMMRIALLKAAPDLIVGLKKLQQTLSQKWDEFKDVITSARTHLQDAVPITVGQEFKAYSDTVAWVIEGYETSLEWLKVLGIWGTASGTGINTHPEYHAQMVRALSWETGIDFKTSSNLIASMRSQRQIGVYMNALTQIAHELSRMCNDLRLLSSGPFTGFGELNLPAVQPGSSIMPGKVNPSILECVNMVCFRILGADTTMKHCLSESQLNLNIWMPLMIHETLNATKILTNALKMMTDKCISGIEVNKEVCEKYAYESNGIFTALNPILGYQKVADIVHIREESGKSIKELLLEKTDLSEEEITKILDPKNLTTP